MTSEMQENKIKIGWMKKTRNTHVAWQIAPVMIVLIILFLLPVMMLLGMSFLDESYSLTAEHYQRLWETPLYGKVLWITVKTALWVTLFCLLGAYPIAYLLATVGSSTRGWLSIFVLMPFWTSFLVRTFSWIVLLGKKGAINQWLEALGIIDRPIKMMFNFTGVMVGMTHALMPLAVLTMLAVMVGIDRNLMKAASTMGAKPGRRFWKIYFPLSMPGVAASGLLIFISSLGFFITPALLGSPRNTMIVQMIIFQIREILNWRFAGAIGVLLLVTFFIIFYFYDKIFGLSTIAGGAANRTDENKPSMLKRGAVKLGNMLLTILASLTDMLGMFFSKFIPRRANASRTGNQQPRRLLWAISILVVIFLALPTFFIIPVSFTSESFLTWPPKGFSTRWYELVFDSPLWLSAALRSLLVALAASAIGMFVAVPCAFAIAWRQFPGKAALFAFLIAPIIVPNIFIAVGLFFMFSKVGLAGTTLGIILGHTIVTIPYIAITTLAVVKGYDRNLDYAAAIMGAGKITIFRRITLPVISAGMVASFMFAFIHSFDELTIAMFVTSGKVTTLPKLMFEDAMLAVSPRLAAIATLLLIFSLMVIFTSEFIRRKGIKNNS